MQRRSHKSGKARGSRASTSAAAGAAAGLIGGLVASWLMVEFQHRVWPPPKGDGGESSTSKLARDLARLGGRRTPTDDQAKSAGELIHYGLGAGLGLLYGAAASTRPAIAAGAGLPFGIATEIIIDQALVPALGLSNPFWKCPVEWHVRGLAAHLVFGLATEASRRLLLSVIDAATDADDGLTFDLERSASPPRR